MIALVTALAAFPLGFLLRSRLAATTAYAVAYLWAFVFQTAYLMLDLLGGAQDPAFRPSTFPLSYGAVALGVFTVGLGLVQLGHRAGRGRRARRRADGRSQALAA